MNIEELLLKKEELPILRESCFQIPIHPRLLDETLEINPELANQVLPQVTDEWYTELGQYCETLKDEEAKAWIKGAFLKKGARVIQNLANPIFGGWTINVSLENSGFAEGLSIGRNGGGSLYFDSKDTNCKHFVSFDSEGYIRFPRQKAENFALKIKDTPNLQGVVVYTYGSHNIDAYPGALFLRNWAIAYENEALKEILKVK